MSHKPFNGLKFTNTVPKFLQGAIAKHGIKNSFLAKKFESEDGDNNETNEINRLEEKPEILENRDRKDTEFEKPVIMNVDLEQIKNLNMKQREQLNDIIRESQMKEIKALNNENVDDEDKDVLIAKKLMEFASAPSQNVIGMEKKCERKFKFTKKTNNKNDNNSIHSLSRKRKLLIINDDEDDNNNNSNNNNDPPKKKRKIYQEMSKKQLKKQRKKLKFKANVNTNNIDETENIKKQTNSSMLSFDPDEE